MTYVAAISPNGHDLVYVGQDGTTSQLYHRPFNQVRAVAIPGTEGAENPFFSPDGEWVGFKFGDTVQRVRLDGGTPITVCALPLDASTDSFRMGMSWDVNDMIWVRGERGPLPRSRPRVGYPSG